jgi:Tfp pilus assembly protein PilF
LFALMKMGAIQFKPIVERRAPRRMETPVPQQVPTPPPEPVLSPLPESNLTRIKQMPTGKSDSELLERLSAARRLVQPDDEDKQALDAVERAKQHVRLEVLKSDKIVEIEHHVRMAEQFYRLAEEKFDIGDHWNVAQLCKQAIKNNPTEPKYYNLMAKAYAQHPKFGKDAEQCFYKALEMDPWNADYHVDLARFYFTNGLSKRALAQCQKAVKLSPQHGGARQLLQELARMAEK